MKEKRLLPDGLAVYGGLALLLVLGLAAFVFRQDFSFREKRYLAEAPRNFSLAQWTLHDDLEAFLSDQVPLRQPLVQLDASVQALTGRSVQLGAWPVGDALVEQPVRADADTLLRRVEALREFAGGIPCRFLTPPTAGMLRMEDMTPARQAVYAEESALYALVTAQEGFIPVEEAFRASAAPVYYRTDHHWNGTGAYLAYRALCGAMGLTPLEREDFRLTEYGPFLGTTCARSGLPFVRPDTLECAEPDLPLRMTADGETFDRLIFPEEAASWDGYAVYLKGNHGLVTIENPAGHGTLFVCKDSFANSVIPLLAAHFARICAVDARYYAGSFRDALEEAGGADEILFLYSLDSLANDTSIPRKLRGR